MSVLIADILVKRDRIVVIAGLAAIVSLAWGYMFYLDQQMIDMESGMEMAMPHIQAWGPTDFLLTFAMWAVMMVAMMTPSAAPMILMFSKLNRQRRQLRKPWLITGIFLAGYIAVWTVFSAVATIAQWGLQSIALLSPMLVSTTPVLGGVVLIGAGAFQFTTLKQSCLAHCRSPLGFLMSEWQEGNQGALRMGLKHGAFCVGCCWLLMTLLFVAGVMNLLWVAAIAVYVLMEKMMPGGYQASRVAGLIAIAWGVWLIA